MSPSATHPAIQIPPEVENEFLHLTVEDIRALASGVLTPSATMSRVVLRFYQAVNLRTEIHPDDSAVCVEGPVSELWTGILNAVIRGPNDEQQIRRVAEMVLNIKGQPLPAAPQVSPPALRLIHSFEDSWGQRFWGQLPVFGLTVREYIQSRAPTPEKIPFLPPALLRELLTPGEWDSLRTFMRLCTDMGVMDLSNMF